MKVQERDGSVERQILAATLLDDRVCAAVASKWQDQGLYRSRWANVVGKWATDYCKKHNQAPRKNVESLFAAWAKRADETTVSLVESFLESISEEFSSQQSEINPDYVIDLAGKHFNEVKLENLLKEVEGLRETGNCEQAWELLTSANKIQVGQGTGIDVLSDEEALERALSSEAQEPLFTYPGAAGEFFDVRDCFNRDCFVAFAGPKGRSKSFWLIDASWRAMEQRKRVAFFAIGDMSQDQMMRRFLVRAAKRPIKPGVFKVPVSITRDGNKVSVAHEECECSEYLTKKEAKGAFERVARKKIKSKKSFLRLSCHPTKSISITGITSILREWERDGYIPDLIAIDYADLLAPLNMRDDNRDAINASWIAMRALAQTLHCLVLTATQTKATSYYTDLINRDHFADDRRKIDHVNAFIGLCQTMNEKAEGIIRLNFFALREGDYDERKTVSCAMALAIADPCYRSCW